MTKYTDLFLQFDYSKITISLQNQKRMNHPFFYFVIKFKNKTSFIKNEIVATQYTNDRKTINLFRLNLKGGLFYEQRS